MYKYCTIYCSFHKYLLVITLFTNEGSPVNLLQFTMCYILLVLQLHINFINGSIVITHY